MKPLKIGVTGAKDLLERLFGSDIRTMRWRWRFHQVCVCIKEGNQELRKEVRGEEFATDCGGATVPSTPGDHCLM